MTKGTARGMFWQDKFKIMILGARGIICSVSFLQQTYLAYKRGKKRRKRRVWLFWLCLLLVLCSLLTTVCAYCIYFMYVKCCSVH